jgi:hypothetical protein
MDRIKFLSETIRGVSEIDSKLTTICITNTTDAVCEKILDETFNINQNKRIKIRSETFSNLANPWYLTWTHKSLMAKSFLTNEYSHYLYLEDDIRLTNANIKYWKKYREILKPYNVYPSFLRVEFNHKHKEWRSTDITNKIDLSNQKIISINDSDLFFINSPQPYQGMFFYDHELMHEHLASTTANAKEYGQLELVDADPSWPGGGVAERANLGLTYHNVPVGHTSRNVLPFSKYYSLIDNDCLIHHIPNNYTNDRPEKPFGKLNINNLLKI